MRSRAVDRLDVVVRLDVVALVVPVPEVAVVVESVSVAGAAAASAFEAVAANIGTGDTACHSTPKVRAVVATAPQRAGALLRLGVRRTEVEIMTLPLTNNSLPLGH